MTLWTCIVADSGDRKTPGLNVTRRGLDLIEKNNSAATSAKRLAHATLAQRAKEALKQWKRDRETALKSSPPREPPPIPSEAIDPGNFIEPLLYATDPTIERLAALLRARPRGMVLIRDELAGLFANMSRYSGGSDRPFWLEAWNGWRHVVERVAGRSLSSTCWLESSVVFSQISSRAHLPAMTMACAVALSTHGHRRRIIGP
jgi:hypothetical protein